MNKYRKWLTGELERWLEEGIIDKSQAEKITSFYPEEKQGRSWGSLIFQLIGVAIFGLGVILLFAYNWQDIPKFAKLSLIFFALIVTHGLGYYFRNKGESFIHLSETLHVLGTMFFGAGIWLIAQIYNIDEHYPTAFLIWGIGALALGWSLPSIPNAIIATVLFCFWDGFEIFDFRWENHYASVLILIGVLPLAYKLRSKILLSVVIPAFILTVLFTCSFWYDEHLFAPVVIFIASVLISLSILTRKKEFFVESSSVFKFYGNILYWAALFFFTFPSIIRYVLEPVTVTGSQWGKLEFWYLNVFAIIAVILWIAVILPFRKIKENLGKFYRIDHFWILIASLAVLLNRGWLWELNGWTVAGFFNLIFLFQSIMLISFGCKSLNPKLTAAGILLVTALVFARYSDLFDSLLIRAFVFLIVGAGIFSTGIFYIRRKNIVSKNAS